MNLQEQRDASTQLEELWRALMPHFEAPGPEQFLLWAGYHSPEVIGLDINRAAAKRLRILDSDCPMSVDSVVRYASGVMRNVRADLIAQRGSESGRRMEAT